MTDGHPKLTGLYRITSLARPVDPAYLTNKALLILLPILATVSAGMASLMDSGSGPLSAAFSGALVAFVAWALTRELAPDYNDVAFVALAFAWAANVALDMHQVVLAFVALLLVRLVNRSTGLPFRPFDTLSVFGLCLFAAVNTEQPLILLVASLAFALDAILDKPLRVHYVASLGSLAAVIWLQQFNYDLIAADLTVRDWSLLGASALGLGFVILASPVPVSYCDTSPDRLDRMRVNGGLIVGWLLAIQTVITNGPSAWLETPIWVCVIAVLLSGVRAAVVGQR